MLTLGADSPRDSRRTSGFPFPADRPDGTSIWDPHAAVDAMYSRLPSETARALAQRLGRFSNPAIRQEIAELHRPVERMRRRTAT